MWDEYLQVAALSLVTCEVVLALVGFDGRTQQASLLAHNIAHPANSQKKQEPVYK
jgi:hypothetical protein